MNKIRNDHVKRQATRSVLAVPGHQFKMVESAARSAADAVFIDLEDAVPPGEKETALRTTVKALNELDWGDKSVSVRVNSDSGRVVDSEIRELTAEAGRLDLILLPKVESVSMLQQTESLISARPTMFSEIGIEALIETSRGVVMVDEIAAAGGRLVALHFGVGDFSASIGARNVEVGGTHPGYMVTRKDEIGNYQSTSLDLWMYPMMRILVAARAFGLRAIDGPCGAFKDAALTRSFALKAAAMGYDGKQVIHPDQIAVTQNAFTPTKDEVAYANKIVAAMLEAEAAGLAAVAVDGKMVDYANVRMAKRLLAMAN